MIISWLAFLKTSAVWFCLRNVDLETELKSCIDTPRAVITSLRVGQFWKGINCIEPWVLFIWKPRIWNRKWENWQISFFLSQGVSALDWRHSYRSPAVCTSLRPTCFKLCRGNIREKGKFLIAKTGVIISRLLGLSRLPDFIWIAHWHYLRLWESFLKLSWKRKGSDRVAWEGTLWMRWRPLQMAVEKHRCLQLQTRKPHSWSLPGKWLPLLPSSSINEDAAAKAASFSVVSQICHLFSSMVTSPLVTSLFSSGLLYG